MVNPLDVSRAYKSYNTNNQFNTKTMYMQNEIKAFHAEAVKIAEKEGVILNDLEKWVSVSVSYNHDEICYYVTITAREYPYAIGNSSIQGVALQQFKDSLKRHQEGA